MSGNENLNMLHTSPESMANFLSKIGGDIEAWSNGSELQGLVERLRRSYARTYLDPERMLIDRLNGIADIKN